MSVILNAIGFLCLQSFIFYNFLPIKALDTIWYYRCEQGYCLKDQITDDVINPLSKSECDVLCLDSAGLWPKPTGGVTVNNLREINIDLIFLKNVKKTPAGELIIDAFDIFASQIRELMPCRQYLKPKSAGLPNVEIEIQLEDQTTTKLQLDTDESYILKISDNNDIINVIINSPTFFGARHGLETLSQLVIFDDLRYRTLLPSTVLVSDRPAYSWRGISLDTSRNYITPQAIKRTLKGMAASKLNTFHWHLTDTASFPYVSKSRPELSQYGAYSPQKVYENSTIMSIIKYANVRGIRIVPELDAPAHVGEGWQSYGVVTCFNWRPWQDYCVEPPCGQFDPSQKALYDILEDIYGDMLSQFGTEVFHMGGDEVNINCWNNTETLKIWMVNEKGWELSSDGFLNAWSYFQTEAATRLYKKAQKTIPVVLWTSELTSRENVVSVLPPENYLIQVWDSSNDLSIRTLLEKNYRIILSNYDAVYLDCGAAGWVTDGNNWCSPFKGWQLLYDNKPVNIAGNRSNQVMGGEAAMWTEQVDTLSLDESLWPRAAAYAETLWAEPKSSWRDAEERMLLHRERLVKLGISSSSIQPEWCLQNQQSCPLSGKFND